MLSSNDLSGPIPRELGNLSSLAILDLRSNELTGQIPRALENLSNLVDINLSGNSLTGCIPAKLLEVENYSFRNNRLRSLHPPLRTNPNPANAAYPRPSCEGRNPDKWERTPFALQHCRRGRAPRLKPRLHALSATGSRIDYNPRMPNLSRRVLLLAAACLAAAALLSACGPPLESPTPTPEPTPTPLGPLLHQRPRPRPLLLPLPSRSPSRCPPPMPYPHRLPRPHLARYPRPNPSPLTVVVSTASLEGLLSIEFIALAALHSATNGDNWTNDANWLSSAPFNTWHVPSPPTMTDG